MSVPSRGNGRILLIGLPLVAVIGLLAWWIFGRGKAEEPPAPPTPVAVVAVAQRDVPHWATGIGTVQSLHSVTLRPQVAGVLSEVLFEEGQEVTKGELLARIDDRPFKAALAQAQAEKSRIAAQLKGAQLDLTRYANLLAEDAISQQTVQQQTATVDQLKAQLQSSEAAIAVTQVQLSFTRITSPLDGRVGLRRIDAGNLVQVSDTTSLVTVTQLDPISVIFSLPQDQLAKLRPLLDGEAAVATAFDRDGGTALAEGSLSTLDNEVDQGSGMFKLRAQFTNAKGRLWPGQFVTIRLRTGTTTGAMVVPAHAVRQSLDGSFVYRIVGDKAEMVPVKSSYQDDEIAIVDAGLAAGERVVIDGYSRLKPGSPVKVIAPATSAGTATAGGAGGRSAAERAP